MSHCRNLADIERARIASGNPGPEGREWRSTLKSPPRVTIRWGIFYKYFLQKSARGVIRESSG